MLSLFWRSACFYRASRKNSLCLILSVNAVVSLLNYENDLWRQPYFLILAQNQCVNVLLKTLKFCAET